LREVRALAAFSASGTVIPRERTGRGRSAVSQKVDPYRNALFTWLPAPKFAARIFLRFRTDAIEHMDRKQSTVAEHASVLEEIAEKMAGPIVASGATIG